MTPVLLRFFLVLVAVSVPFWLIGAFTGWQIVPGLPISALMAVCPMIAAAILCGREGGARAVVALLKRPFDCRKIATVWYLPILVLKPAIMLLSYELMRAAGSPLPSPQWSVSFAIFALAAFLIMGITEEAGWSGYVLDRLQRRWTALESGILLGLVWALWHIPALLQAHRSAAWIGWHAVETVATRVLMVWIYNNTRASVFAASLYHAVDNLSWIMFPNLGSHYEPRVTAPITVLAAAGIAIAWDPRTLARARRRTQP